MMGMVKGVEFNKQNLQYIKQCYRVVWGVEKIHKVKFKKPQKQKRKNNAFIKTCSVW